MSKIISICGVWWLLFYAPLNVLLQRLRAYSHSNVLEWSRVNGRCFAIQGASMPVRLSV